MVTSLCRARSSTSRWLYGWLQGQPGARHKAWPTWGPSLELRARSQGPGLHMQEMEQHRRWFPTAGDGEDGQQGEGSTAARSAFIVQTAALVGVPGSPHLMGSSCTMVTLWPRQEKASVGRCCGAAAPAAAREQPESERSAPWTASMLRVGRNTSTLSCSQRLGRMLVDSELKPQRLHLPGAAQGRLRMASFISKASASCPTAERSTCVKQGQRLTEMEGSIPRPSFRSQVVPWAPAYHTVRLEEGWA